MHIHFEKSINAHTDCTILSLSWMGKVPEELPEDEGWKLNRNHYYQEGWLATGNIRGILGVTYTTSHWKRNSSPGDLPQRSNYNLRGHRSQVTFVQWNEPYQKLASCDSSGIIFVWIKYEGRWSIELINDRSTPVTHFSWSHDGRMALICYQDGFVLVGSVAGQRYWSTGLNLDGTITCGIWTPDDQQVYFGTSNGQIVVMDVHGTMLSQVQLPSDSPIASMSWSCEKFKMEESEDGEPSHYSNKRPFVLAVCFTTGGIYIMKNYDDIAPLYIFTGMHGLHMEWSNSGEFLAIAGSRPVEVVTESGFKVKEYLNHLHIYSPNGIRILNLTVPYTKSPITALTWGHNDKRIFLATGKVIHVGWVSKRIASLQLLCRLTIYKSLSTETCVSHLPLPLPVRALISSLHTQTILSILPNMRELREFVSHPPAGNLRLHCTMLRHEEDANQSPGTVYTLYVEYLGGLVPILKGKRTSKIRPEFVIFDPSGENGSFGVAVVVGNSSIVPTNGSAVVENNCAEQELSSAHNNASFVITASSNAETNVLSNPTRVVLGQAGAFGLGVANSSHTNGGYSDSSDSDDVELCASPRLQRKRYRNRQRERERMLIREREREWERTRSSVHLMPEPTTPQQLVYNDVLPENVRLVEVTSNIWGTKFKINGLGSALPENLGSITYKTSLLHLQPRQMTLVITELRDDIFLSPDNAYAHADDEEEDLSVVVGNDSIHHHHQFTHGTGGGSAGGGGLMGGEMFHGHHVIYHPQGAGSPVVPPNRCFLQPKSSIQNQTTRSSGNPVLSNGINNGDGQLNSSTPLVNNPCEIYSDDEDEYPYVNLTANPDMVRLRETLRETMLQDDDVRALNFQASTISNSTTSTNTPVQSLQTQAVCQQCDSPMHLRSVEDASVVGISVIDLQERHNNLQRIKSNLVTRAQIEHAIDENSVVVSVGQPSQSPPQPSLHRTAGSIRSPTRICWGNRAENNVSGIRSAEGNNSSPVIQPAISAPIHVRRSMSASYLDSVDHQVQLSLDVVNNDGLPNSPPKRLVLIKKTVDGGKQLPLANGKPRLRDCGKSKSWDSCDISWWRSNYSNGTQNKDSSPCPKCSFPAATSTKPTKLPVLDHKVANTSANGSSIIKSGGCSTSGSSTNSNYSSGNAIKSGYHTISTSTTPLRRMPQTPARSLNTSRASRRRQRSTEDQDEIEHAPSLVNSTPIVPPTPTATPRSHRRSLSLLTPLLRRRELTNRQNHVEKANATTGGGNPASSSFIPPGSPQHQPRSSPSTPASQRRAKSKPSYLSSASSPFRQLFANSPLLSRRRNKNNSQQNGRNIIDSSDDEGSGSHGEGPRAHDSPIHSPYSRSPRASVVSINSPFRDLETFQKQQLRQKLRKKKIHNVENCPFPRRREFQMHNKAPMWNEQSQVYQLDFGGRVTQESAKNFQIEFRGKQVMQFGRIDGNAYTLDFQYPFSALQAFSVALANVTQRLK